MCQKEANVCRQRHADFVIFLLENTHPDTQAPQEAVGTDTGICPREAKTRESSKFARSGAPRITAVVCMPEDTFFFRLRNPHFTGDFSLCSAQKRSKHLIACTPPACTVLYLHREIKTMGVQSQAHPVDLHQAPCSLTSVPAGQGRVRAAPLCLLRRDPHPI